MSKLHKFKEGDIVKHNYSDPGVTGEIHDVRNDKNGYDYFIRFTEEGNPVPIAKDWYKEEVLELV